MRIPLIIIMLCLCPIAWADEMPKYFDADNCDVFDKYIKNLNFWDKAISPLFITSSKKNNDEAIYRKSECIGYKNRESLSEKLGQQAKDIYWKNIEEYENRKNARNDFIDKCDEQIKKVESNRNSHLNIQIAIMYCLRAVLEDE